MKNVITILVDSVMWDCVSNRRTACSVTPFLDSLKRESVTASRLYSHGPYTDAATKSLYTGRNCLDDFGYYFRLNSSPSNHFKVFKENGYETFGIFYPYYTVGKNIRNSIDHRFYSSGFIFKSEWGGIFKYYSEMIAKRELSQTEWKLLIKRTHLMFDTWGGYYNDIINNPRSGELIKEIVFKNISSLYEQIKKEENEFQENPQRYLIRLLKQKDKHPLWRLETINFDNSIDRKLIKEKVYKKYKQTFRKFKINNLKTNIIKNAPSFKRIFSGLRNYLNNKNIDEIKFLANYFVCLRDVQKSIDKTFGEWQDIPSARKHFRFAADVLKEHQQDKPFYLSLHILDPHNYVSYFSYDMLDDQIISEEIRMLENFVNGLGNDYIGSLPYLLAIRYVDFCLEEFCNELKKMGVWDNTTLLIVADHGSSYSFSPLHGARVNCFDDECYHVPMLIRCPGIEGKNINEYYNSKDVFPTLFDVVGIKKPDSFIGHSMLDKSYKSKPYVITEYMGPGCPDMLNRPMWLSIRDDKYIVAYKVGFYQSFEEGCIVEVYNIEKDPHGYVNIKSKICINDVQYLLSPLKDRFEEIKCNTQKFIDNL